MSVQNLEIENLQEKLKNGLLKLSQKQLSMEFLKVFHYDEIRSATPIIKITKGFGIRCFKKNISNQDIVGTFYINGKANDIYNYDKAITVD